MCDRSAAGSSVPDTSGEAIPGTGMFNLPDDSNPHQRWSFNACTECGGLVGGKTPHPSWPACSCASGLPAVREPDERATLRDQAERLASICSMRRFLADEAEEAVNVLLAIPGLLAEIEQLEDELRRSTP